MKLLVFGVCLALTVFLTFDKYPPKERRINVVICAMVLKSSILFSKEF